MSENEISRRNMMKKTAAASLALSAPVIVPARALGKNGETAPSERVNIGLIACGSRSGFAQHYSQYPQSQVVAVCDPIRERRMEKKELFGNCADYVDFRDLLARDDVDAVHISTPDHWHVPISLAAARAGKDMYTEKPLGISIEQCLAAREIGRKHKRIFQYGTQNRSVIQVRKGLELVLNGHIGEVKRVHVWCPQSEYGGSTLQMPVPEDFDYELWLGPAPDAPFSHDRCLQQGQRNGIFHIYDYALGFIAGWGAHPMDTLQWWADEIGLGIPVDYQGTGALPANGLFNTLTHWDVTCTYANGLELRFMDNATARFTHKVDKIPHLDECSFYHGTMFEGTEGWVTVYRHGWQVYPESLYELARDPGEHRLVESSHHIENFVDSVLSREEPASPLESAVRSDIICHLSDIAVRLGRRVSWDASRETIVGDPEAQQRMFREMREPWTL